MTDSYTTLNTGSGGDLIDEEAITYGDATIRKRSRVQIGGAAQAEIARVAAADPTGTEFALFTRNIPSGTQKVQGTDYAGNNSRLSTDDAIVLLRRLLEVCEPLATQDSANRQKVTVDSFTAGLALPTVTTVTGVTTVTTVTTVSTVTTCAAVTTLNQIAGYPAQWNLIDQARNAYANGIRSKLVFS